MADRSRRLDERRCYCPGHEHRRAWPDSRDSRPFRPQQLDRLRTTFGPCAPRHEPPLRYKRTRALPGLGGGLMVGWRWLPAISCALVATLAGCGGAQLGALRTPGTVGAGALATPQAVVIFTVQARNTSAQNLTLRSVTLLDVPGLAAPTLVHYAVLPGLDALENARGWPPPPGGGPGPNGTWPLTGLNGYVVPGHKVVSIVVGVKGSRPGTDYVMGGLVASYGVGGSATSSVLAMVNLVCVAGAGRDARGQCANQQAQALMDRALSYVHKTFY